MVVKRMVQVSILDDRIYVAFDGGPWRPATASEIKAILKGCK